MNTSLRLLFSIADKKSTSVALFRYCFSSCCALLLYFTSLSPPLNVDFQLLSFPKMSHNTTTTHNLYLSFSEAAVFSMFNSVAFCCNMTCITVSVVVIVFCYCCHYTIKRGKLQEKKLLLLLLLPLSMSTTLLSSATIVKNCEQGRNSRHFPKGIYTVVS